VPRPAEFSVRAPFLNGFVFMGLRERKSGKALVNHTPSSSGVCHDPRAGRGIWKKCDLVFETLDPGWLPWDPVAVDEAFSGKQEFGV